MAKFYRSQTHDVEVYRHKLSQFYQGRFWVWDSKSAGGLGKWKRVSKSTKSTDEPTALSITREYARAAALAHGADGSSRMTREYAMEIVNSILRLSGVPEIRLNVTWVEASDAWILSVGKANEMSRSRYRSRIEEFTTWLGPRAKQPLQLITAAILQEFYASLLPRMEPQTAEKRMSVIRSVFERSRNEGLIEGNPAKLVTATKEGDTLDRQDIPPEVLAVLLRRLLEDKRMEWLALTLFGLCTSQRIGDCKSANWVNFKRLASESWQWKCKQGKTGKTIVLPIVEPLSSILEQRWKDAGKPSRGAILPELSEHSVSDLSRDFIAILEGYDLRGTTKKFNSGREYEQRSFHSLRHSTATLMANAGVAPDVRKKVLGHSASQVQTHEGYTHHAVDILRQALVAGIGTFSPDVAKKKAKSLT